MTVLAIDQGTSGTKALLLGDGGDILAVAERPVQPRYLDRGGVEVDPAHLLSSVIDAGRQALADAGRPRTDAVALANQGETVLAWDADTGQPLSEAIVWQDRRSDEICGELADQAERLAQTTGLVLDAYFSAPKMAWLRRHRTSDGVVTTTDTWLVHQLSGAFVTDATTASRSLLLDVDALTWDDGLVDLFGLDGEALPRIVGNDEVVGHTDAFGPALPLGGLIVDQQAALAAQRCLEQGTAKCTYGTGAFLLANTGQVAHRSAEGLTTSAAWSLRDETRYCLDGQVHTAGSAIRWLVDIGLLTSAEHLDAEAGSGSGGVRFVPALSGLAAPWWYPTPAGAFLDMGLSSSRGHLLRAVIEGLGAQIAVVARQMVDATGHGLDRLRVDGGLTRSKALMQAQADLLQVPIDCYPSPHATARGAGAMGRLAVTPGLTLSEAIGDWKPTRTFEPRWTAGQAEDTIGAWCDAVNAATGHGVCL